jgi:SAM-dependent methyltransferase
MAQNVYDRDDFFRRYSRLSRSVDGLAGAPEWPVLRAMLPDVLGLRIVDLGCGFGWFCRWAQAAGAASVLGLDVSENMLARARSDTTGAGVRYERADLEQMTLEPVAFDLAYSSLAFHYVADAARLYAMIARALVPGGRLVFSTEHPILMAPEPQGWSGDPDGRRIWPLNRYFAEGPRETDWLSKGVVKHHRTMATTLNTLIASGFRIDRVEEFCPTDEQVRENPALAEERERPTFLLVAARLSP